MASRTQITRNRRKTKLTFRGKARKRLARNQGSTPKLIPLTGDVTEYFKAQAK